MLRPRCDRLQQMNMGAGPLGKRKFGRRFKSDCACCACLIQGDSFRKIESHRDFARADDTGTRRAPFDVVAGITGKDVMRQGQTMLRRPKPAVKVQFIGIKSLRIVVFVETDGQTRDITSHRAPPAGNVRVLQMVEAPVQVFSCAIGSEVERQTSRIKKRD